MIARPEGHGPSDPQDMRRNGPLPRPFAVLVKDREGAADEDRLAWCVGRGHQRLHIDPLDGAAELAGHGAQGPRPIRVGLQTDHAHPGLSQDGQVSGAEEGESLAPRILVVGRGMAHPSPDAASGFGLPAHRLKVGVSAPPPQASARRRRRLRRFLCGHGAIG
jgi:hypothetical protein